MLGLTKSAVGTSTLHLDTMTTSNAGRIISLLTLKDFSKSLNINFFFHLSISGPNDF